MSAEQQDLLAPVAAEVEKWRQGGVSAAEKIEQGMTAELEAAEKMVADTKGGDSVREVVMHNTAVNAGNKARAILDAAALARRTIDVLANRCLKYHDLIEARSAAGEEYATLAIIAELAQTLQARHPLDDHAEMESIWRQLGLYQARLANIRGR